MSLGIVISLCFTMLSMALLIIFGCLWHFKRDTKKVNKAVYKYLTVLSTVVLTISIPFLINESYKPNKGYITIWGADDLLSFYGSVLSFIGTVSLGILALWQNHQYKKQADELSESQLRPYINIFNSNDNLCTTVEIFKSTDRNLKSIVLRLQNVGASNILDIKSEKYLINGNEVTLSKNNKEKMNFIAANEKVLVEILLIPNEKQCIDIDFHICNAVGNWYLVKYELKIAKVGESDNYSGKIMEIKKIKGE